MGNGRQENGSSLDLGPRGQPGSEAESGLGLRGQPGGEAESGLGLGGQAWKRG